MNLDINREISIPLYIQIYEQIKDKILTGAFPIGYQLPPERKLAEVLGVNRSTILNAYRELKAAGLIESKVGKGTVVSCEGVQAEDKKEMQVKPLYWYSLFNQNIQSNNDANILDLMEMMNKTTGITFAAGMGDPQYYPIEDMAQITKVVINKYKDRIFEHTPIEGIMGLRKGILRLQEKSEIYTKLNEIMVLSGSQQGLDLLARVFLEKGDVVIVEEPTYLGALQVFKSSGVRIITVPLDEHGMRVDLLEANLKRYKPKFIYTMPTFHNPTGYVMSLERRRRLLDLAYNYQVPIIEDDAYGSLRYDGLEVPTLKSMDCHGYVIYLNTFSKVLFPGLRLGWVLAPKEVIKQLALVKQNTDIHSSSMSQWIMQGYLEAGYLDKHISKIKEIYRERRDEMESALKANRIKGFRYHIPDGGFYIWCQLPGGLDASKLLNRVSERGVIFVQGEIFFTGFQGKDYLRLNFTTTTKSDIQKGIKILMDTIKEILMEQVNRGNNGEGSTTTIY